MRTFIQLYTRRALTTHEIPHTQRAVPANRKRDLARWVHRDAVHAALVPTQRAEHRPVARMEERKRAVLRGRQKVGSGGKAQVR